MKAQLQAELASAADDTAREEITAAFASREKALGKTSFVGLEKGCRSQPHLLTYMCSPFACEQSTTSTTARSRPTSRSRSRTTSSRSKRPT